MRRIALRGRIGRIVRPLASAALVLAATSAPAAPGDLIYARAGRLVEVDGATLNLYCMGAGTPTVLLDSGHQDWAPAWAVIQPRIASWTRVCSFDRPGYGFSPAGPMPRTSERIATELHDALHASGIEGPYVLVGHAFGGYNMRAFAYRYPPEVAGLVLIDSDAGDTANAELLVRGHGVFVGQAAEIQQCRDALAAHLPAPKQLDCASRFFRGFPDSAFSPALNVALARAVATRPELSDTANAELEQMPADELYLREHRVSLGSRPVRVITAEDHFGDKAGAPDEVKVRHARVNREMAEAQAAFLGLSSNAKQVFARHSYNAYVQLDEPDLVLIAIEEAAGRKVR